MAPSRYGPTNPPVLPTALISAIDAAPPTPRTAAVASAQKGPNIEARPSIAIDSDATDDTTPLACVLRTRPVALTSAAIEVCQRRSPVRSEWRPTTTIAIAPAAYGMAVSAPTSALPAPDAVLIICGSQNPMPYSVTGISAK